uniref:Glyco_transf_7N domain-containing protein n=1 Tax=Steinernema glaseri TaxID=37863 RepID=A0A1I7ZJ18_9BILA
MERQDGRVRKHKPFIYAVGQEHQVNILNLKPRREWTTFTEEVSGNYSAGRLEKEFVIQRSRSLRRSPGRRFLSIRRALDTVCRWCKLVPQLTTVIVVPEHAFFHVAVPAAAVDGRVRLPRFIVAIVTPELSPDYGREDALVALVALLEARHPWCRLVVGICAQRRHEKKGEGDEHKKEAAARADLAAAPAWVTHGLARNGSYARAMGMKDNMECIEENNPRRGVKT